MRAEASSGSLQTANAALQAGEADTALTLLDSLPASAEQHNLRCRVRFALEQWDAALSECERAVSMDENNSRYHMWLARVLGEKASRASFMSAFSLAKRSRAEFETSVRLDGRNADALADLGEFYRSAPGVVGGGMDKAEGVASQMDKVDPVRGRQLHGWIAEEQKDYATTERELKAAIGIDPHPAFAWMSLASFYRRRQQWDDMQAALRSGVQAAQHDREAGVALYNAASVLIKANRDLQQAAKMIEDYLRSSSMTEEAPAFAAHTQLARVFNRIGDAAGAREQRGEALALAHEYKPAQDLKL